MRKPINLSIIIPAYNEETKIKRDIAEAIQFLITSKQKGEIIVSTDGVTDKTNTIVKSLMKVYPNLLLLAEKNKIGKGAAIKKGVAAASGEIIMFADAGLCVPYRYALKGLALLEKGFDCAMGSRAEKGSRILRKQPLYRYIGSNIFKWIIHTILHIPHDIKDTQCGFKLYKKITAKKIFHDLQTEAMMFDIEVILRLVKNKNKIATFPVEWKNDEDTKFDPLTGSFKNIKELFLIKIVHRL
jgi:glycosyltransferase involved in cell wall biosynthesis